MQPELSDGSPLCQDYTAAAVIQDTVRLQHLRSVFELFSQDEIQITRSELNSRLLEGTDATEPLTVPEFNAVMVSLANTDAAVESKTESGGYSQYTFTVNPDNAVRVCDQQLVAAHAMMQVQSVESDSMDVQLVATLPREIEEEISADVGRLDISLRRMLMNASDVVRVANPYFDPKQWISPLHGFKISADLSYSTH
jgi:hypothetical protein